MHLYDLKIKSALIFCMAIQSRLKITYNFNITHMCVTLTVTVVISCSIRSQAPNYTPDNTLKPPFRGFIQLAINTTNQRTCFNLWKTSDDSSLDPAGPAGCNGAIPNFYTQKKIFQMYENVCKKK